MCFGHGKAVARCKTAKFPHTPGKGSSASVTLIKCNSGVEMDRFTQVLCMKENMITGLSA